MLRSSLRTLSRLRGCRRIHISGNNFFLWKKGDPTCCLSPDAFLVEDAPSRIPDAWRMWQPNLRPPSWAAEIVSNEWNKDYDLAPAKYGELGCSELVVFDPDAALGTTRNPRRKPLTVYRLASEGRLEKVSEGAGPAWSVQLQIWLLPLREGYSVSLRLSEDEAGTRLIPTEEELAESCNRELARHEAERQNLVRALNLQRAALEAERAEREILERALDLQQAALDAERAEREAERAAHDREVRMLKEQLEGAQAKPGPRRSRRGRKPKPGGK
jgi:hypothetical protein